MQPSVYIYISPFTSVYIPHWNHIRCYQTYQNELRQLTSRKWYLLYQTFDFDKSIAAIHREIVHGNHNSITYLQLNTDQSWRILTLIFLQQFWLDHSKCSQVLMKFLVLIPHCSSLFDFQPVIDLPYILCVLVVHQLKFKNCMYT